MRRFIATALILGAYFADSTAQQDPQFSQNMFNKLFPNPGVAGSNQNICITALGRQQWAGFDGKPETFLVNVHAPVSFLHGGAGLSIAGDRLGQEETMHIKAAYAFRKAVGVGFLGVGVGVGLVNKKLGNSWVATDPVQLDPKINDAIVSEGTLDFDFGVYYKSDKLYMGLSTTHISESEIKLIGSGTFDYRVARHYYIMAGYTYDLSPNLAIQPSTLIKSDAASAQMDINVNVIYNSLVWGGLSYRVSGDALVPMIGMKYDLGTEGSIRVGYSYDLTLSALKNHSQGSHELMLGYCFNIQETQNTLKYRSVRFL